ncbi:unnamed protein product [Owenia fusiformis]|uniref:Uncharacterized protein n=1 Tax=Owenia fusiformis TaxID=6347 RepID=A0A8J1UFT3_OWEFU|nr:unnamed protein product [Owenia fusiformis]
MTQERINMAESLTDSDRLIESVTCAICMNVLNDPRCLPCMHTFCMGCIQDIMDLRKGEEHFPCPICREPCSIMEGAVGLKANFFARSVLEAINDRTDVADVKCDVCRKGGSNVPATSKCVECNEKFCKGCERTHRLSRFTEQHQVLGLTGDKSLDEKNSIALLSKRIVYCERHKNEALRYYCKSDERLICQDCFAYDHQGHVLMDIEETAKANMKKMSLVIDLGKKRSDETESAIVEKHAYKQFIENNMEDATAQLDADLQATHDKVEAHFKSLKVQTMSMGHAVIKNIIAGLAELQFDKDAIDGTVKQLENLQAHGNHADIVYMVPEMTSKLESWSTPLDLGSEQAMALAVIPSRMTDDNNVTLAKVECEALGKVNSNPHNMYELNDGTETGTKYVERSIDIDDLRSIAVFPNDEIAVILGESVRCYDKELNLRRTLPIKFEKKNIPYAVTNENGLALLMKGSFLSKRSVQIYDISGDLFRKISVGIKSPRDIAMKADGDFLVLTSDGKIIEVASSSGDILETYLLPGSFDEPFRIDVNSLDDVVVSDKFYIRHFSKSCSNKYEISFSFSAIIYGYSEKNEIERFDKLKSFGLFDSQNDVVILNARNNKVQVMSSRGRIKTTLIKKSRSECVLFDIASAKDGAIVAGVAYHTTTGQKTGIITFQYRSDDGELI